MRMKLTRFADVIALAKGYITELVTVETESL